MKNVTEDRLLAVRDKIAEQRRKKNEIQAQLRRAQEHEDSRRDKPAHPDRPDRHER